MLAIAALQLQLSLLLLFLALATSAASAARVTPRKLVLVPTPPTVLTYHDGPLLTAPSKLTLYFLWYGRFTDQQKAILRDFASSFSAKAPTPSVSSWWSLASSYVDKSGSHVASTVSLSPTEAATSAKPGVTLTNSDLQDLLLTAIKAKSLPSDASAVYFILTADDVAVEDFCMNSCGTHDSVESDGKKLVYAWVGNAGKQCPGYCAWPYAKPDNGPADGRAPLRAPNGDVGIDGMVINMAALLAGAATNPYSTGYYQGDALAPLEAATACTGIFGPGAFPGDPGSLATDNASGASYNAHGANSRLFLLPALWNPSTQLCTPLKS